MPSERILARPLDAHAREFVSPFLSLMHAAQEKMQISAKLVNL